MKAQDLTELIKSGERTPDEICPVLYTMSILGQRWKFPVLWHLASEGTLRYNQIKKGIPLITNIMLTQTLRELEEAGLIIRHNYDSIPPKVDYALSERGQTLIPILYQIHDWGYEQMKWTAAQSTMKTAANE